MQFLLHPSQGRMARFALADASQRSTGWRKWILVLKPGFDSTPLWIYLFFGWFWEPGPLNRRGRLFSLSPVAPHACSPSGCLFPPKHLSLLPFLPRPLASPLCICSRIFQQPPPGFLGLVWGTFSNFHHFQEWVEPVLQTASEPYLPSTLSDHLIVVSICLNFILCVLRPITGPDTLPALSKCVWVSTWQNQCRIHHQPLLHTSSLARYPW